VFSTRLRRSAPRPRAALKITIAHTLLKIAYQVLKSGKPYQDLGADFYTRRESPAQQHAYLERRLQKLYPGCAITITISPPEAALTSAVNHAP
jgi:transposase